MKVHRFGLNFHKNHCTRLKACTKTGSIKYVINRPKVAKIGTLSLVSRVTRALTVKRLILSHELDAIKKISRKKYGKLPEICSTSLENNQFEALLRTICVTDSWSRQSLEHFFKS